MSLKWKTLLPFLPLGIQDLFRQRLSINISFAINLEYTIAIANYVHNTQLKLLMISFVICILIIYMDKRSRNH